MSISVLVLLLLVLGVMCGFTSTFKRTWSRSGETIEAQVTTTADAESNIEVDVAASDSETITVSIDISQLKSIVILSDVDMTLETNSPTDDTIELVAGKIFEWNATSGYFSNPFTVDITEITVTNNDAEDDGTFKLRAIYDSTI